MTIIGSEIGLSPVKLQAIIGTNAGLLSIGTLWTYYGKDIYIEENAFENIVGTAF